MASSSAAAGLLARQLKQMQNDKSISGISCGLVDNNVFEWEVMLMIDDDTKFYGGTHSDTVLRGSNSSTDKIYRRFLPRAPHLPKRIPSLTTKDALRDTHLPPKQCASLAREFYVSSPPLTRCSLPKWRSMHLDPAPARRRQVRLRIRRRTLVARSNTRNHSPLRHIHAL
jgi:hypothetical protein